MTKEQAEIKGKQLQDCVPIMQQMGNLLGLMVNPVPGVTLEETDRVDVLGKVEVKLQEKYTQAADRLVVAVSKLGLNTKIEEPKTG